MTDPLFTFEPEKHTYKYDGKKMTGCTTILGVLAKPQLIPWAARMVCDYIRENALVLSEATEQTYLATEAILKEAQVAHAKKRDEGATKGTDTHALVEDYVKDCIENYDGKPYRRTVPNTEARANDPLTPFVKWTMKEKIRFISSEAQFYSKKLWVAGTADLIFEKDGKRYLGDIKTYKKIWDRTPFYQCAGYALMAEEMGEPKFDGYCIINLPKERTFNETEDIKWSFDIEGDTQAFLACVTLYRQNANF
jgi:hypothetical protein